MLSPRLYDLDPKMFPGYPPKMEGPKLYALLYQKLQTANKAFLKITDTRDWTLQEFAKLDAAVYELETACENLWHAMTDAEKELTNKEINDGASNAS